jgi:glyoxylase-like metal-dependent hydrolase (beta-lactamase superfamily II)
MLMDTTTNQITKDVYGYRTAIANITLVGECGTKGKDWVLVDAGVPFSGNFIKQFAEALLGPDKKPIAIVLTHAHFDHVGGLSYLLNKWQIPVYIHEKEQPYVTGRKDYPPPHPFIEKGLMAFISPFYPRKAINIHSYIRMLPSDGSIPEMPGWKWIHTPGHTEGHVSLFREKDRLVIAGDALITVKQESALAVITQRKEIHAPPAYFTQDWDQSFESILKMKNLHPELIYTGHGKSMKGKELTNGIDLLIRRFEREMVKNEKYVHGR